MARAYLVYNPAAGRFPSGILAARAAEILASHGWEIEQRYVESGEQITRFAEEASAREMDAFFVVGGDGSVNQAIPGLVNGPTALGVLPAGTANVWAQELGLPGITLDRKKAIEMSAQALVDGRICHVDVGLCSGRPFLLWAGIGLDAFIVHRIEPRTQWEKHFSVVHYTASAIWNAGFWRGTNLRVEADDHCVEDHFLLAVVSNIHLYAGGLVQLSPEARLDDGIMDLWLFKGETLGETVQIALDMFYGRHLDSDRALRLPFRKARISSSSPVYIQVDGEKVDAQEEVFLEVRRKALKVLVPKETPLQLFSGGEDGS